MTPSPSATVTTATAVDQLLDAIAAGEGATTESLYAPDALLDATVPEWRFTKRGAQAIAAQWATWFADAGRFEELERHPIPDGEVVRYLLASDERGMPFAVHHCHVLTIDESNPIISKPIFT